MSFASSFNAVAVVRRRRHVGLARNDIGGDGCPLKHLFVVYLTTLSAAEHVHFEWYMINELETKRPWQLSGDTEKNYETPVSVAVLLDLLKYEAAGRSEC
jgi:hypothetical protein